MKMPRPKVSKNDPMLIASFIRTPYVRNGNPQILRDTVLYVSHITGRGTNRDPWMVVVTDETRTYFWHFEPSDLARNSDEA
jgi:hypothetical protein